MANNGITLIPSNLLETQRILTDVQRVLRLCRPKAPLMFIEKYLTDMTNSSTSNTTSMTVEEKHAFHMLPFLISQPDDFRSVACTVFIAQQFTMASTVIIPSTVSSKIVSDPISAAVEQSMLDSSDLNPDSGEAMATTQEELLDSANGQPPLPPAAPSGGKTAKFASKSDRRVFREFLDGNSVLDIIQTMDLPSLGVSSSSIVDDFTAELIEPLKLVDFKLFLVCIRLVLTMHQIIAFIKDEALDYLVCTSSEQFGVPLPDDVRMDVQSWKAYLIKKHGYTTSFYGKPTPPSIPNRCRPTSSTITHNYHLHHEADSGAIHLAEDFRLWTKLLIHELEDIKDPGLVLEMILNKVIRAVIDKK